jgi:hypothetical protein
MGGITFKEFLLRQDLIALQESLQQDIVALEEFDWASITKPEKTSNIPNQKIDINTQISNLKKFIGKRTDNIKLYEEQIKKLEVQSKDFPQDKQANDAMILDIYKNIGILRNHISKATKEIEKISNEAKNAEAQQQSNIGWKPKDDKHAQAVFKDVGGKSIPKFGLVDTPLGGKEVITASDKRWMDYDGNQRGGRKPVVNPPPLPGARSGSGYKKPGPFSASRL